MARSRFQAPRVVRDFEQVQTAFRQVQEALDAATASRAALKVNLKDFALTAGNFHRASSQTSDGLKARLPAASGENLSEPVILHLENMMAPIVIYAAPGQTVNGESTATFSVDGIVIFWSNGVDSWSGIAQVPAESPAGEALDAEYVLGSAHLSLPNAAVATDTAEINVSYVSGGTATWALVGGSVGPTKLTPGTARQVLRTDDTGVVVEWGFPVQLVSEAGAQVGKFHSIRFHGGTHTTAAAAIPGGGFGADTAVVIYNVDVASLLAAIDSTSIVVSSSTLQRAAVSGDITIAQNSNTAAITAGVIVDADVNASAGISQTKTGALSGAITKASGASTTQLSCIRTNSTLQTTRTFLHLLNTNTISWTPADDGANDEWEMRASVILSADYAWTGDHSYAALVSLVGTFSSALVGTTNNLAIGTVNRVALTTSGAQSLTGMVPTVDGQMVWLENTDTTDVIFIEHLAGTSSAANQFQNPGASRLVLRAGEGAWFRYNTDVDKWVCGSLPFIGLTVSDGTTSFGGLSQIEFNETGGIDQTFSVSGTSPNRSMVVTTRLAASVAGDGLTLTTGVLDVDFATAAQMEAGSSGVVAVSPSLQHRHQSAAKFWLVGDGDGVGIEASYNVSTMSDTGVGNMTVNINTDFSSVNWCCGLSIELQDSSPDITAESTIAGIAGSRTAGTVQVINYQSITPWTLLDPFKWHVFGFGDQ